MLTSRFIESVQTTLDRSSLDVAGWVAKNFTHPKNKRINWSYKDHEFQKAIMTDKSSDVITKKPSQKGLSEIAIRIGLAFCSMLDGVKMAYILPTSKFSTEFAATRIDPAIETSEYVTKAMSKDVNNTSVKRIGDSFLFMRGTSGEVAAISVDLDLLIIDELDFCDQDVLGTFSSRLQHSEYKLRRRFSTPTLDDFGISALYADSDRKKYLVKHESKGCGKWVWPNCFKDIIIPGGEEYGIEGLLDLKEDHSKLPCLSKGYVKCPECSGEIKWQDFANPALRRWVAEVSEAGNEIRSGYWVKPWDGGNLKTNNLEYLLREVGYYSKRGTYLNFVHGESYSSSDNSFLESVIKTQSIEREIALDDIEERGVFIGADLGKISHVVIGVDAEKRGLRVIWSGTVDVREIDGISLGAWLVELFGKLNSLRIVVDAAPNYETALQLVASLPRNKAYGAYYSGANARNIDIYNFNDNTGIVTIDRTASFDDLAEAINGCKITFPSSGCMTDHLLAMRKAPTGGWINVGPDHYAHALNYMYCAWASLKNRLGRQGLSVKVKPQFSKVRIKG